MRNLYTVALCALIATPACAQDLPPGPGSEIVERACQTCHGLEQVTSTHHDADGWRSTVTNMIANGAVLTDAEQEQVVKYLTTNFGPGKAGAPAP